MKLFICLIFCLYSNATFSKISNINKTDSIGQKQGLWIEYDSLDVKGYCVTEQIIPDSTGKSDFAKFIVTKYELIKHQGYYINGLKTGLWKVYEPKNKLWMKILYDDFSQRTKIEIYYPNKKLYVYCEIIDSDLFIIKVFSKKGTLIKEKKKSKDIINKISETELYKLGF
jgi:antitoxin component YwqK of YwqJK toxin-antitoxin module